MINNALISVIVPVYNTAKYIRKTIESILKQSYRNIELILVDDGSTDGCSQICEEYVNLDSRVKVLHKPNEGLVKARKDGLQISTGNYVSYIDCDDFLEPEYYSDMASFMFATDADIVVCSYKEDIANSCVEIIPNSLISGIYEKDKLIELVYPNMINNQTFSNFGISTYLWNKLFKRDLIYDVQMNVDDRITLGEDACVTYPAILNANKICITNSSFYHYIQRTSSMMKTSLSIEKDFERISILYQYLKKIFTQNEYSKLTLPQLDMYILSLATVFLNDLKLDDKFVFPFKNIQAGSNVIICGAGNFGQHLYKRFSNTNECKIVNWIDANYTKYKSLGLNVCPIHSILADNYDYVINAYVSYDNAKNMHNILKNYGVPEDKIVWLDYDFSNPKNELEKYNLV